MTETSDELLTTPTVSSRPLCVDLDGTLVKNDTTVDSMLLLVRNHPLLAVQIPLWLMGGIAVLKARVAASVELDVEHLPWNHRLLEFLTAEHNAGRKLFLATGTDMRLARRVADHLALFEDVLASDGLTNHTGANKLANLQRYFADQNFDYIGNDLPDASVLACSARMGEAMVANPTYALCSRLRTQKIAVSQIFEDRIGAPKSMLKALRLHQWTKNVLIFSPLLLAHMLSTALLLRALAAFFCFSLCASATYIFNDLLDIEVDRRHWQKRLRPFAAGDLPVTTGIGIAVLLLVAAFVGASFLPHAFPVWLLVYFVITLTYSLHLRQMALVDVLVLSGLYTLRLIAGAAAEHIPISHWFAAFSVFLFLSLAIVKRFSELKGIHAQDGVLANGRGYRLADIEQLRSFGTMCGLASVVIFALYINSGETQRLYRHPERMWLIVPLLILWVFRIWLLASRGELEEDPVIFAVTDCPSLVIFVAIAVLVVFAAV